MGGDLKKKIGFEENNYCSVRKKTSKYVTVTPDADEERINVPCMQTCSWKEKLSDYEYFLFIIQQFQTGATFLKRSFKV